MCRKFNTARSNYRNESIAGTPLPEAIGKLGGKLSPEIGRNFLVYPPVAQDPDLMFQKGYENENAGFPSSPVETFLVKCPYRPFPHRFGKP